MFDGKVGSSRKVDFGGKRVRSDQKSVLETARKEREQRAQDRIKSQACIRIQQIFRGLLSRKTSQTTEHDAVLRKIAEIRKVKNVLKTTRGVDFIVPKDTTYPLISSLLVSYKLGDEELLEFVLEIVVEGMGGRVEGLLGGEGSGKRGEMHLLSPSSYPTDLTSLCKSEYLYDMHIFRLVRLMRLAVSVPLPTTSANSSSQLSRLMSLTAAVWSLCPTPVNMLVFIHLAETCALTLVAGHRTQSFTSAPLLTYLYSMYEQIDAHREVPVAVVESVYGVVRALLSMSHYTPSLSSDSSHTNANDPTPSSLLSLLLSRFSRYLHATPLLPPLVASAPSMQQKSFSPRGDDEAVTAAQCGIYRGGRLSPPPSPPLRLLTSLLHCYLVHSQDHPLWAVEEADAKGVPSLLIELVGYLSSYLLSPALDASGGDPHPLPSLLAVLQKREAKMKEGLGVAGATLQTSSLSPADLPALQGEYIYLSANRRLDFQIGLVQSGVVVGGGGFGDGGVSAGSDDYWEDIVDFFLDKRIIATFFTLFDRAHYTNTQKLMNIRTIHFLSHVMHIYHHLYMACPIHLLTGSAGIGGAAITPMQSELRRSLSQSILTSSTSSSSSNQSLLTRLYGYLQDVFDWGVSAGGAEGVGWAYPAPIAQGGLSIFHTAHPYFQSISAKLLWPEERMSYGFFTSTLSVFLSLLHHPLLSLDDQDLLSASSGLGSWLGGGQGGLICRLLRDRLWGGLVGGGEEAHPLSGIDFTSILPTLHLAIPFLHGDGAMDISPQYPHQSPASRPSWSSCVSLLSPLYVYATGVQVLNEVIYRGERPPTPVSAADSLDNLDAPPHEPLFDWERDIHLPSLPNLALKEGVAGSGSTGMEETEEMFPTIKSYTARCILTLCHMAIPFPPRLFLFRSLLEREKSHVPLSIFGGPMVKIRVHRGDRLLGDAYRQVMKAGDLKGKVSVEFVSHLNTLEAGIDGGGLFKEFLNNFSLSLLGGQADESAAAERSQTRSGGAVPLFREVESRKLVPVPLVRGSANSSSSSSSGNGGVYVFPRGPREPTPRRLDAGDEDEDDMDVEGPDRWEHGGASGARRDFEAPILDVYKFVGKMVGKALYEGILLNCEFSPLLLNLLLGRVNTFDDLQHYDRDMYKSMLKLKKMGRQGSEKDIEALGLHFEVTLRDAQGNMVTVPLLPPTPAHPEPRPVTLSNLPLYLSLVPHVLLNLPLYPPTRSLGVGMSELLPAPWLRLFSPRELGLLISGIGGGGGVDISDMKRHVVYAGGYGGGEEVIRWFWEVLAEMGWENQELLLKFVTSVPRAPLLGFGSLNPPLCIQKVPLYESHAHANASPRLPMASTCVHMLRLPPYPTKEVLREKLMLAISSNSGFELT